MSNSYCADIANPPCLRTGFEGCLGDGVRRGDAGGTFVNRSFAMGPASLEKETREDCKNDVADADIRIERTMIDLLRPSYLYYQRMLLCFEGPLSFLWGVAPWVLQSPRARGPLAPTTGVEAVHELHLTFLMQIARSSLAVRAQTSRIAKRQEARKQLELGYGSHS